MSHRLSFIAAIVGVAALALFLIFRHEAVSQRQEPSADAGGSAQVTTLTLKPERVVLIDAFPGRVAAYRRVEIRPQVTGIIKKRLVEGGTEVR
ncbi:hypothetical protein K7H91_13535 [Martelella mediterranea]|uniref:hypothetical protein n=1 Tax=Martelella mediterranea TaxID=293089 RepID=UPI002E7AE292|nr:hypothetical protein [Martelella mediterranea]MCD1634788.1 hypothetical protein [Martelella mediterranea]